MKHLIFAVCGAAALSLAACSEPSSSQDPAVGPENAGPPGAENVQLPEVDLPTQEEADAQAAEQINDENADAEFQKLQEEILGGDG